MDNLAAKALIGPRGMHQVERVLETTLAENLAMIVDTVTYLRSHGREVQLDAEHFFDGHAPSYPLLLLLLSLLLLLCFMRHVMTESR